MVNEILREFGLSDTQIICYQSLLSYGPGSAQEIANRLNIKRTTAFMALNSLIELKLVEHPDKQYEISNPDILKKMLKSRQQKNLQISQNISNILPSMLSQYKLSHKRPGIIYKEGLSGLKTLFDDIIKTKEEILIFPSDFDRLDVKVSQFIDQQILRQQLSGIKVRVLYPSDKKENIDINILKNKNVKIKEFGSKSYKSQIIIYGNKLAITNFHPEILTTIILNEDISDTYKSIFENIWNLK
jgi:sugar-specific transcriptional regulator TrmB